jgi:hypothetical protein
MKAALIPLASNELLDGVLHYQLALHFRFLAIVIKAIPMIKSGIETQNVPKSATLFRFRTANTAAATRKAIPIKRRDLDDKIRPPLGSSIYSLRTELAKPQILNSQ